MADAAGQQSLSPYHAMACNPSTMVDPLGLVPQYMMGLNMANPLPGPQGAMVEGNFVLFGGSMMRGGVYDMMKSINESMDNAMAQSAERKNNAAFWNALLSTVGNAKDVKITFSGHYLEIRSTIIENGESIPQIRSIDLTASPTLGFGGAVAIPLMEAATAAAAAMLVETYNNAASMRKEDVKYLSTMTWIFSEVDDYFRYAKEKEDETTGASEHTKGSRNSTKGKHEKANSRSDQDRNGSKGMKNPPRNRPKGWTGPWP